MRRATNSITITDPLVKYQSMLATGRYCPDPAQHRLAVHLHKVYSRLKDYTPSIEYYTRLQAITNALNESKRANEESSLAVESHPIRRNPLLARFFSRQNSKDSLALTRVLTSYEEAIHIDSPQGFFLSGEVGTGKSMLLDLLADGLPTSRKKRWHFSTFMLYTLSQLERHRKTNSHLHSNDQYSLLWMAKEMIDTSPILFLDEFQLPDRAASKIISNLFTAFFQLGGVLVASSNRMPEELEKAAGFEYTAPTSSGLIGRALGLSKARGRGELFGASSDFSSFLEVLRARCEFWQMEGGKDWRRHDVNGLSHSTQVVSERTPSPNITDAGLEKVDVKLLPDTIESTSVIAKPRYFFVLGETGETSWEKALDDEVLIKSTGDNYSWTESYITVYGRVITIPAQHNQVVRWDFKDLVSSFGPADYITMASTFHTFIIDNIPVLTILQKNEARRLITLLDALYEARCKLIVRAEVGPDDLFFPETKLAASSSSSSPHKKVNEKVHDAIHSETIAEAYQDTMSPFRPNISSYSDSTNTSYDPDQDSDFHVLGNETKTRVDFSNTGAFTGEDERFAYKRAASRLWELCGSQWHAREGEWWQPLPLQARHWEGGAVSQPKHWRMEEGVKGDVTMGESVELDEPAGLGRLRVDFIKQGLLDKKKEVK
ncbi:AFG1-like ATPase-domain-containing protein [Xylariaceae sp. FL0016]|nr:AFG1-like ATPase-domain-containing protein [Xylariaceae sp. FL0016]